jgi:hypothetical protein
MEWKVLYFPGLRIAKEIHTDEYQEAIVMQLLLFSLQELCHSISDFVDSFPRSWISGIRFDISSSVASVGSGSKALACANSSFSSFFF